MRLPTNRWPGFALLGLMFSMGAVQTQAHKPVFIDRPTPNAQEAFFLENVNVSQVVYFEATSDSPQLWLAFDGTAGQEVFVQLSVPVIDRLRDFRPAVAVLGPGLPPLTTEVPFTVPGGYGGVAFTTDGITDPMFFHEPFTGTDSWIYVEQFVTLAAPGTQYIVGYVPSGQTGKFWIAVGQEEQFGLSDLASFPETIAAVRSFHEVPQPYCPCVGFFSLLGIVMGFALMGVTRTND